MKVFRKIFVEAGEGVQRERTVIKHTGKLGNSWNPLIYLLLALFGFSKDNYFKVTSAWPLRNPDLFFLFCTYTATLCMCHLKAGEEVREDKGIGK